MKKRSNELKRQLRCYAVLRSVLRTVLRFSTVLNDSFCFDAPPTPAARPLNTRAHRVLCTAQRVCSAELTANPRVSAEGHGQLAAGESENIGLVHAPGAARPAEAAAAPCSAPWQPCSVRSAVALRRVAARRSMSPALGGDVTLRLGCSRVE